MYKFIGADGKQYGPVSADQIRQWIAENRLNGQTLAQAEGAAGWQPLSSFPEFAEALAAKAPPAAATPPGGGPPPVTGSARVTAMANEIIARPMEVQVGSCLRRAWELYQKDFWNLVGINALLWILIWASNSTIAGLVLSGPLLAGLYWYNLKRVRGQPAEVQDAFSGFTIDFVQTMVAGLIASLLIGLGLALCLVPGIYLYVAWGFALPLVLDKRLQAWDALELSRKVVTHHWWGFFGLALLTGLINLGGLLLCGLGLFFTLPWTTLAWMYAYEDTFGTKAPPAA